MDLSPEPVQRQKGGKRQRETKKQAAVNSNPVAGAAAWAGDEKFSPQRKRVRASNARRKDAKKSQVEVKEHFEGARHMSAGDFVIVDHVFEGEGGFLGLRLAPEEGMNMLGENVHDHEEGFTRDMRGEMEGGLPHQMERTEISDDRGFSRGFEGVGEPAGEGFAGGVELVEGGFAGGVAAVDEGFAADEFPEDEYAGRRSPLGHDIDSYAAEATGGWQDVSCVVADTSQHLYTEDILGGHHESVENIM